MNKSYISFKFIATMNTCRTHNIESSNMNKVYLVKEIQYEWVTVLAVYTSKIKAELHCKELLSHKVRTISVIN